MFLLRFLLADSPIIQLPLKPFQLVPAIDQYDLLQSDQQVIPVWEDVQEAADVIWSGVVAVAHPGLRRSPREMQGPLHFIAPQTGEQYSVDPHSVRPC